MILPARGRGGVVARYEKYLLSGVRGNTLGRQALSVSRHQIIGVTNIRRLDDTSATFAQKCDQSEVKDSLRSPGAKWKLEYQRWPGVVNNLPGQPDNDGQRELPFSIISFTPTGYDNTAQGRDSAPWVSHVFLDFYPERVAQEGIAALFHPFRVCAVQRCCVQWVRVPPGKWSFQPVAVGVVVEVTMP